MNGLPFHFGSELGINLSLRLSLGIIQDLGLMFVRLEMVLDSKWVLSLRVGVALRDDPLIRCTSMLVIASKIQEFGCTISQII
jgi:hypothetical protein